MKTSTTPPIHTAPSRDNIFAGWHSNALDVTVLAIFNWISTDYEYPSILYIAGVGWRRPGNLASFPLPILESLAPISLKHASWRPSPCLPRARLQHHDFDRLATHMATDGFASFPATSAGGQRNSSPSAAMFCHILL